MSVGTFKRYRQVTRAFITFLGTRIQVRLEAITTDDLLRYRDALLAERAGAERAVPRLCRYPRRARRRSKLWDRAQFHTNQYNSLFDKRRPYRNFCTACGPGSSAKSKSLRPNPYSASRRMASARLSQIVTRTFEP